VDYISNEIMVSKRDVESAMKTIAKYELEERKKGQYVGNYYERFVSPIQLIQVLSYDPHESTMRTRIITFKENMTQPNHSFDYGVKCEEWSIYESDIKDAKLLTKRQFDTRLNTLLENNLHLSKFK